MTKLNTKMKSGIILIVLLFTVFFTQAQQDTLKYVGSTLSNIDYHHGQLSPAVGVHATQIMRASREHPEKSDGFGWTYNHAPNIAYWNNTFFVQYLSDPVGEHIPPSQSFLQTSKDGENWSFPEVVFPMYNIPDGYVKEGVNAVAKNLKVPLCTSVWAFLHHRIIVFLHWLIMESLWSRMMILMTVKE
ncbi:hypothetical protein [Thalassobellus suaedae]|uniref:BT-1020-like N-terminal beta-propeller domain-containing protein n=1 Tax=Thalassobellus suaedae TaxID=3074124 RepID=A0ABY9XU57_9FLAO|nr:hypothetical protein RHP51_01570 [Flavobacteriaceae bacterium HL-DH14]